MLCQCSCCQPCPFGKTGMAYRCAMADVAARLGCPIEDAPAALKRWQEAELSRMVAIEELAGAIDAFNKAHATLQRHSLESELSCLTILISPASAGNVSSLSFVTEQPFSTPLSRKRVDMSSSRNAVELLSETFERSELPEEDFEREI
jgi:hypothetical protein